MTQGRKIAFELIYDISKLNIFYATSDNSAQYRVPCTHDTFWKFFMQLIYFLANNFYPVLLSDVLFLHSILPRKQSSIHLQCLRPSLKLHWTSLCRAQSNEIAYTFKIIKIISSIYINMSMLFNFHFVWGNTTLCVIVCLCLCEEMIGILRMGKVNI